MCLVSKSWCPDPSSGNIKRHLLLWSPFPSPISVLLYLDRVPNTECLGSFRRKEEPLRDGNTVQGGPSRLIVRSRPSTSGFEGYTVFSLFGPCRPWPQVVPTPVGVETRTRLVPDPGLGVACPVQWRGRLGQVESRDVKSGVGKWGVVTVVGVFCSHPEGGRET